MSCLDRGRFSHADPGSGRAIMLSSGGVAIISPAYRALAILYYLIGNFLGDGNVTISVTRHLTAEDVFVIQ